MSGEIGFHIQEEILKRLPVKSLVRFRSVCKAWRCLIDSSYFIAAHTARQHRRQHLLVRYAVETEVQYVYMADDETFPQQRFVPTLPLSVKLLQRSSIVGSCNGLVCLDGFYYDPENSHSNFEKAMIVLWNPSIRKSVAIPVPGRTHEMDQSAFGFGVCPLTNDPKIVMIRQLAPLHEKASEVNDPREVMLYALSSEKWRSINTNVPSKSVRVKWCVQVIGRFMYWSGSHQVAMANDTYDMMRWTCNMIMSFDMTNDTFEVIDLPESLAHILPRNISISKLRNSLVILDDSFNSNQDQCVVWMMRNGVQKSFTGVFTIFGKHGSVRVRALGFRKSGAPIIDVGDYSDEEKSKIRVYEPSSQRFNNVGICGIRNYSMVRPYMETLLLLGRSDCDSY